MLRLRIDPNTHEGDLCEPDEGSDIETAAILSVACDASAQPADPVQERRGYWGDAYAARPGDVVGSRLWELGEAIDTDDTMQRAEQYAEECFRWGLEDGTLESVTAVPLRVADGRIAVDITLKEPGKEPETFRVLPS